MQLSKRKKYVRPRVEAVALVPDEAVLGGCKTSDGGGSGQTGGSGNSCQLVGGCTADGTS